LKFEREKLEGDLRILKTEEEDRKTINSDIIFIDDVLFRM